MTTTYRRPPSSHPTRGGGAGAGAPVGRVRRGVAAAVLLAVPAFAVACDDGGSPDGTTPTEEVNPDSTTSGVAPTSDPVDVPTSVSGGPAGQGSIPEQPGGTAQPMEQGATNTTSAPDAG